MAQKQRALVLQGGGALGAYEAGVYRVLYDWISNHDNQLFFIHTITIPGWVVNALSIINCAICLAR
jgi:NTE family protein